MIATEWIACIALITITALIVGYCSWRIGRWIWDLIKVTKKTLINPTN